MTDLLDDPALDHERCYRAVASRDARFDGWFIVGVTSTGIYCRPSCPAPVRPKPANTRFFPTAAAAQSAGFRACKRCLPDASPGSPAWDVRGDLAARAMRAIADGIVDRSGVPGLAASLAVSERHLGRVLTERLGASPLALARARRAQSARTLIETTDLPFTEAAFAAGFSSVRQFNDTIREVFATTPTELRRRRAGNRTRGRRMPTRTTAGVTLRLAHRPPLPWPELHGWFARRAIPGVDNHDEGVLDRTLRLPGGPAHVRLRPGRDDHVLATIRLRDVADLGVAVQRCRRLLDLDADPTSIADVLGRDRHLGRALAGREVPRCPGAASPDEALVRAIVGQQVSVAAATTVLGRLAAAVGVTSDVDDEPRLLFPDAGEIADLPDSALPMPRRRAATLRRACAALAQGELDLRPGADRAQARADLLELPGIGPWTAGYVTMRALHDPDVLLVDDLGVRRGAGALGLPDSSGDLATVGSRWSPWRSYASEVLWRAIPNGTDPR